MSDIAEILRKASKSEQPIEIIYNGGSQPGRIREILPVSVGVENVQAICMATHVRKTFKLRKINLPGKQDQDEAYVPGEEVPESTCIAEGVESFRPQLEGFGWALQIEEGQAGLYRRFKNGNLRKTPDVYVQYNEYTYDYSEFDDQGKEIVHKKLSKRPWYVRSNMADRASSFSKLSGALDKFVQLASDAAVKLGLLE